jgi:signal transduction histidine kinase
VRTEPVNQPPPASAARLVGTVSWLLPLILAVLAVVIEWSEHVATGEEMITAAFFGEVFLFAVVGPVAVAITLRWVARILDGYRATATSLETMNRSLEAMVAERTEHLEAATHQLAEANKELAQANSELRQLDRLKSEFVSLVSHQLRAPLTNINGALEIVAQDADRLPAPSQRTLQILILESQRLSHLIQTILDVSRIEAGRLTLRLGPVAVEPILARASAAAQGGDPGRSLALDIQESLPPAWADEVLIEEVVRNLVENAVHYSPTGSLVTISAEADDAGIVIAVTDHGPGVPADEQAQIFRSFYRLGETDSAAKGYGLGLYFADKLVRAQGGTVTVTSPIWPEATDPGARFAFTLPIAAEEPDEPGTGA